MLLRRNRFPLPHVDIPVMLMCEPLVPLLLQFHPLTLMRHKTGEEPSGDDSAAAGVFSSMASALVSGLLSAIVYAAVLA